MAERPNVNNIGNLQNENTALQTINENFNKLADAFTDVLSHSKNSENTMNIPLDMNGQRIINLPIATQPTDPVRRGELQGIIDTAVSTIARGPEGPPGPTLVSLLTDATPAFKALNASTPLAQRTALNASALGICISPFDKGAGGKGLTDDTAQLQAVVNEIQAMQNSGFIGHGVIDLRGGSFAVSAPITMSGSPYDLTFQNGSIRPFGSYSGILIDLDPCVAATRIRFLNLSLNGYGQCSTLLRLSKKTQACWVAFCSFIGFTSEGLLDQTTDPATELMVICNEFQGGTTTNVGTAIHIKGNDGYICDNVMRNINTAVFSERGGNAILRNHMYSVNPVVPISAVTASTGDQMQINDNYIDCAYLFINNPSNCQINNNKFFMTGTDVAGFTPIVLRPTAPNSNLQSISVVGNTFQALFPNSSGFGPYYPVRVDTTLGSFAHIYGTVMANNVFTGFYRQATEPRMQGTASNVSFVPVNFNAKFPWGGLVGPLSATVVSADGGVSKLTISGSVVFVTFSATLSGQYYVQATCNEDFI